MEKTGAAASGKMSVKLLLRATRTAILPPDYEDSRFADRVVLRRLSNIVGRYVMRAALFAVLGLALCLVTGLRADDKKDDKATTLKGTITCAKCDLGKETKCMTVIVVKEDGKDVVYYLDAKSDKANHKQICQAGKPGSVTGKVAEKDGKKTITATKVAFE